VDSPSSKPKHSGSETRQRTKQVIARLTPAERQQVEADADRAGLALGSYVRARLLTGPPIRAVRRPPVERHALAQVLALLGRVGGNVYQISRAANFGERWEPEALAMALKQLTEMRNALLTALGRDPV
jgi:hypothetical protein